MSRCAIVGEEQIVKLLVRYDGIGTPLTRDETQILLFALYCESKERAGIVALADAREKEIVKQQSIREVR